MKIQIKFDIEKVVLILFFAFMLYYGCAQVNEYKINIAYPHGFRASDAFWHPSLERHIQDVGNYKYNPPYIVFGYNDTVGSYPPIRPYLVAMFSFLTGIDPYNIMLFVLVILSCFSALIMYLIIKQYSKHVALLSLPLIPFLFHKNFYAAFTWGQFGFVVGGFFFLALVWSLTKLKVDNSFILIALFLTGAALSHTPEVVIAIGFIIFYFLIKIINKQLTLTDLKKIIFAFILLILFSTYYLIIFRNTWFNLFGGGGLFGTVTRAGFPYGKMIDFGWLLPIILIGIILSLILIFIQKSIHVAPIIGIYMLLVGYSNYIIAMLANSAFQTRFIWPLYLSFFFGLATYQILKWIIKESSLLISGIFAIGLIILFMFTIYEKNNPSGMIDADLWNSFNWIRANTSKDAQIYFFYGDRYEQTALLFATERNAWKVDLQDYIATLQNQTVKRIYNSYANQFITYKRKGLFKFEKLDWPPWEKDICSFDYYVFDKVGQYQPLIQYNMFIENMFLNNGWMERVYSNPLLDIIKNNKSGVNCVALQNTTG